MSMNSPLSEDNMSSPMSNSTYFSNNMSPLSSTSEGSSYNFQNLNILQNDYSAMDYNCAPYLTILEEPVEKFRFRYKSEMHGTHGSLTGRTSTGSKKTFPTVQLHNFGSQATVRCSLSQLPSYRKPHPAPHSHSLVIRVGNEDKKDPHEVNVSQAQGYMAVFQGMGIIHTARKFIEAELYEKFQARRDFENTDHVDEEVLKNWAKREASEMNLNQVCLCFEAFEKRGYDWVRICSPIYSKPINNMKSALTGELKITRLSSIVGNPSGGEEIFMFVEKVGKKNIKIRFCETDEPEHDGWEGWAKFTEADVHHQYAIALRTPKYKDGLVEKTVKVYIQLFRPSDNAISEAVEFFYKPNPNLGSPGRKRPRSGSICSLSEVPSVLSDESILHATVPDVQAQYNYEDNEIKQIMNTWNEVDWDNLAEFLDDENKASKLAKDSVPSASQSANTIKAKADTFIWNTLKKIWRIMFVSAEKRDFEKGRRCIETILRNAKFMDERIINLAIKSEKKNLLQKILEVIDKCRLQKVLHLTNDYNENCLHSSCFYNKPDYVRIFTKYGVDPNIHDDKGDTPLHVAVQEQNINCVTILLAPNALLAPTSIEMYNDDGFIPFHLAVANNNLAICKLLEDAAEFDNIPLYKYADMKKGNSVLHIAVENRSIDILRYLLKTHKVNVNVQNSSGQTPLYLAKAVAGSDDIVDILLQHNAIIGTENGGESNEGWERSLNSESNQNNTENIQPIKVSENVQSNVNTSTYERPAQFDVLRKESAIDMSSLTKLADLLNSNDKWKTVARHLGYDIHIAEWQTKSNPTKLMIKFAEATRIPKSKFADIFTQMSEWEAFKILEDFQNKN